MEDLSRQGPVVCKAGCCLHRKEANQVTPHFVLLKLTIHKDCFPKLMLISTANVFAGLVTFA